MLQRVHDLFMGIRDASFRLSRVSGGKPAAPEKQARDGLIAAAVKILSEGGERRGNCNRDEACGIVSRELNEQGIRDRSKPFSDKRVKNIFLEVTKLAGTKRPSRNRGSNPLDTVIEVLRHRRRQLPLMVYDNILKRYREMLKSRPGELTKDRRKALAEALVRDVHRAIYNANLFPSRARPAL